MSPQEDTASDVRLRNIENVVLRMEQKIESIDTRLRELEKHENTAQAELKLQIEAAVTATKELSKDVAELKTEVFSDRARISTLENWKAATNVKMNIVTWIAASFGGSAILLIWSILTHTVTLSFK